MLPTSGTPILGFCTKEISHQHGTQWELCPGKPQNPGNREPAHKGFICTAYMHTLGPRAKAAPWKVSRPHVKETHLLFLRWMPENQVSFGTLSGKDRLAAAIFAIPFHFANASVGSHCLGSLPVTWAHPNPPCQKCTPATWAGIPSIHP